ncbi:MAG TPA: efflux RND transporter periplasmic adaptor subunit [Longimicrobium sp.]|jgi:HlyD family secretion protein
MRKIVTGLLAASLLMVLVVLASGFGEDEAVEVQTEAIARRDLVSTVPGSGRIEPKRKVDISADISGRVIEVAVEEGEWVDKGDLLLRIDPTRYQAAVYRAEASLAQAQASAEHAEATKIQASREDRRLAEVAGTGGFVAGADIDRANTQVLTSAAQARGAGFSIEQARAGLSEARDALSKTTITAPMSGRVTRLSIQEGETAVVGTMNNPGSLLLTIADLAEMEAHVLVDETDVPDISVGDRAQVRIDAYDRRAFPGRVVRISNSAFRGGGQQSAGFKVVVALDRPPGDLRPELSASAEIVVESRTAALAVPVLAVTVRGPGGALPAARTRVAEGVFVLRGSQVAFVPVKVGIAGEQHFEVKSGLRAGDRVVAGPYEAIRSLVPGTPVRPVDAARAAP